MALIVYGRKVREDAAEVAYAFGRTPDVTDGVVVILAGRLDEWRVEPGPGGALPGAERQAARVAWKALRTYRATGSWPLDATHYA